MFEGKQAPKPAKLRLAELGDGHKIISATDRATDRKKQNLLNRIERVARMPWIFDLGETIDERGQGDCMLKISPERWGLSCHFLPFVPECA
jgi:hypothetical protein